MLHDLYLMTANQSLEAASRQNFEHRTLTFTEMAASCKKEGATLSREKSRKSRESGILTSMLWGAVRL